MRNAMSRRIALKRPKSEELKQPEDEIARLERLGNADADMPVRLREERDRLERRRRLISHIDPHDLRYRRYEHPPYPIQQAHIHRLMDGTGFIKETARAAF